MIGLSKYRLIGGQFFDRFGRTMFGELAIDNLVGRLAQPGRHAFAPPRDFAEHRVPTGFDRREHSVDSSVGPNKVIDIACVRQEVDFEPAQSPDFPGEIAYVLDPQPLDHVGRPNAFGDLKAWLPVPLAAPRARGPDGEDRAAFLGGVN
jgi:hypothetical protein